MTVSLPEEMAPEQRARVAAFLAEVQPARREPRPRKRAERPTCIVCHKPGKVSGHHDENGVVQWVHPKCHRRWHRAQRNRGRG